MIATPGVTNDSIIQVFGPLFLENNVTLAWLLEEGEDGIANWLRALGRQTMTARYIVAAARNWSVWRPRNLFSHWVDAMQRVHP
jgi:hypothetical protein